MYIPTSGRNLMVAHSEHESNMNLYNSGSNYVLKLHPPDDERPRISVGTMWCSKSLCVFGGWGCMDDSHLTSYCQHLFLCLHLVLTLPQKSFIPMGELFEDR